MGGPRRAVANIERGLNLFRAHVAAVWPSKGEDIGEEWEKGDKANWFGHGILRHIVINPESRTCTANFPRTSLSRP